MQQEILGAAAPARPLVPAAIRRGGYHPPAVRRIENEVTP